MDKVKWKNLRRNHNYTDRWCNPIPTYSTSITTILTLQLWVDWDSNMYVAPIIWPGLSPHLYVGSLPVILPKLKGLRWLHSECAACCVHTNSSCSPAQGYTKDNNEGKTITSQLAAHIYPEVKWRLMLLTLVNRWEKIPFSTDVITKYLLVRGLGNLIIKAITS